MHPLENQLIQLQELVLIRDEQKVTRGGKHLEQLDAAIKAMFDPLPYELRTSFDKLHKRDKNVVVPIASGACAVCGVKLPISLVQAVRQGREIHNCPTCARILYFPEAAPQRVDKFNSRIEPKRVGITRFSSQSLMIPKLEATDKEGAIRELATKMEQEGFVTGVDKLIESALRREAIVSTAVDHGMAFPHVRGVEGGGLTLALGVSKKGIKFDANSKTTTKIIIFMVIPTAAAAFYLKLLAGLAETFTSTEARKSIIEADDDKDLWKALLKITRTTIK